MTTPAATPVLASLDLPSLRRRRHPPRPRALVLLEPEGAFAATIARPRPLLALLFVCLWALLPPLSFLWQAHSHGGLQSVIVDEMKKSGAWEKISVLPKEKRDGVLRATTPVMAIGLPVGAASKRAGWILLVSVTCFLLLRATSARRITMGDVVGVVAVGAAPLLVHDLITAIAMSVWDLRAIDPQNAVASNPAAFFFTGANSRTPVAVLLRGLDVFEVWSAWLMGLGVARLTQTRAMTPWLVTVGGHVALTLIGAATATAATAAG